MARAKDRKLEKVRVEKVRLADLQLLELNARFMRHEQYQRLVANIERDGRLTSVPFAWRQRGGKYLVLSGNHRVKGAIDALGEDHEDFVMLCDDPMPKDRRTAMQMAHNAIAGDDDHATLQQLYESIEDVDWRQYSGLDDQALSLLDQVKLGSLTEANLEFQTVMLTFLPTEQERAEHAWAAARAELQGADEAWLARMDDATRVLDALDVAGRSYGVTNAATALTIVLDVFERHLTDLQEGYLNQDGDATEQKRWVPVATVTGHEIPAGAASVLTQAIARMIDRDEAAHPWQALELLAADYLSGP